MDVTLVQLESDFGLAHFLHFEMNTFQARLPTVTVSCCPNAPFCYPSERASVQCTLPDSLGVDALRVAA
jgi:hypothetical protein